MGTFRAIKWTTLKPHEFQLPSAEVSVSYIVVIRACINTHIGTMNWSKEDIKTRYDTGELPFLVFRGSPRLLHVIVLCSHD